MSGTLQRVTSSSLPPQELLECTQIKVGVHPSIRMPPASSGLLESTVGVSTDLRDSSISQQGTLPINDVFCADKLLLHSPFDSAGATKLDASFAASEKEVDQKGNFSVSMTVCPGSLTATNNTKGGATSSGSTMLLPADTERRSKYLQFGVASNSRHNMDGMKQDHIHNQRLNSGSFNYNVGAGVTGLTDTIVPSLVPQMKIDTLTSEDKQKQNMYDLGVSKLQVGFNSSSCNFDSLLNSIIKVEKYDGSFTDNDLGCDFFPLGACM